MNGRKCISICTVSVVIIVALVIAFMIPMPLTSPITDMRLTSSAFDDGGMIPVIYTCQGPSLIPPLAISDVPKSTVSLTILLEDPDTSIGTFDHWVVFNMDPEIGKIDEGKEPAGMHGKGGSGETKYVSPCPPTGIHRYIFTLYALDIKLPLSEGATKAQVLEAMHHHVVGMTKLTGKYGK